MRKYILAGVLAIIAAGVFSAPIAANGGGHTTTTICHKPGTPAEQTLVVDNSAEGLPAHLGHGDTLGACVPSPPPPQGECPEGYSQAGRSENVLLCVKETVRTVEVIREVPGPTVYVDRPVPGPTQYVDKPGPTIYVDKIVEVPGKTVTVTKTIRVKGKTRIVRVPVEKWRTRVVIKRVPGAFPTCQCAQGYRLWKGKCHAIVRGSG